MQGLYKPIIPLQNSKYYTDIRIDELLKLKSPLHTQYERAKDCNSFIQIIEGKRKTSYCNSRACNICNRIRMAKGVNGYMSQISDWNSRFITLTAPTVKIQDLRSTIDSRRNQWNLIRRKLKRQGHNPMGFTKQEVTYNSKTNKVHPHLHIVLKDNFDTNEIIEQWLLRNQNASIKAQKNLKVKEGTLLELFKYSVKDVANEGDKEKMFKIPPGVFNDILIALQNKRTFQPFGEVRKISEDVEELQSIKYMPDGNFRWYLYKKRFIEITTGQTLTSETRLIEKGI